MSSSSSIVPPLPSKPLQELKFWKNPAATPTSTTKDDDWSHITCLCLGTGRFLRSVLVPFLEAKQGPMAVACVQPRGRNFLEYMAEKAAASLNDGKYPVDTVLSTIATTTTTTVIDKEAPSDIQTDWISIGGAFSWGQAADKQAFYDCLWNKNLCRNLQIVGIGLTEAGLASCETPAMQNLYEFLCALSKLAKSNQSHGKKNNKICFLNTDNVPGNGTIIRQHMTNLANMMAAHKKDEDSTDLLSFLNEQCAFLDSMVDRIVAERPDSQGMVPLAEPIPAKALVVLDVAGDLPQWFYRCDEEEEEDSRTLQRFGVVVRQSPAQLQADVALKLRIANATHTAVAHAMALSGQLNTTDLATTGNGNVWMRYLDELVQHQIIPACLNDSTLNRVVSRHDVEAVWDDWRHRLTHPTFGASTFFITQNAPAKGVIRFGPTVRENNATKNNPAVTHEVSMAWCVAVLLRWLTPTSPSSSTTDSSLGNGVYRGSLAVTTKSTTTANSVSVTYADGMQYNLAEGWYEFRCQYLVSVPSSVNNNKNKNRVNMADWLYQLSKTHPQPAACTPVVRAYLASWASGCDDDDDSSSSLVQAVATLYARLIAGDTPLDILQEMINHATTTPFAVLGCKTPCQALSEEDGEDDSTTVSAFLHYRPATIPSHSALLKQVVSGPGNIVASVVTAEVASVQVIDLHTHLLPPQHGPALCLWGIDELLTYHYLVAEYFMTAPAQMTPQLFYETLDKTQQADLIWQALFVDRSPISEACRGVITTLVALGLEKSAIHKRDLSEIRAFYQSFRMDGEAGAQRFSDLVFDKAGVRYNIMTNIPFDANEAQYWQGPKSKRDVYDKQHYKTAVRVDPLLKGDRSTVEFALKASGYDVTLEGARQYLRDWCDTLQPEYVMASTPHDFVLPPEFSAGGGTLANVPNRRIVNPSALEEPGAFAIQVQTSTAAGCDGTEDDVPTVIDESSDFLSQVLMPVCQERDLPVALKIGAHRAVNPALQQAGDGVVAFCDTSMLSRLCTRFPKVRFLATFLSKNNQHEACVLATKFRNLHLYGCWWFCNNPSIIREITHMRIEMLGTAFTCQHSDARVLDQLLYKWSHSRAVIAKVLVQEYQKLAASGWCPTRAEIRRDITRLFGGSYEEFMAKSLL